MRSHIHLERSLYTTFLFFLPQLATMKDFEISVPVLINQWSIILRRALEIHDLEDNILKEVSEPNDPDERKKWKLDRLKVAYTIGNCLIDKKVERTLISSGWSLDEKNPKTTHDLVMKGIASIRKYPGTHQPPPPCI